VDALDQVLGGVLGTAARDQRIVDAHLLGYPGIRIIGYQGGAPVPKQSLLQTSKTE
jgi:hypothetical protein